MKKNIPTSAGRIATMRSMLIKTVFSVLFIVSFSLVNAQVTADTDFNKSFSATQFTDLAGFNNDKPNGLLQEEFNFFLPFNRYGFKSNLGHLSLLRSIEFDMLFNRIDKTKEDLNYPVGNALISPNTSPSKTPYMTTMDIWKYSNFQTGFKVSLISLKTDKTLFQLQYGMSLLKNKPYYGDTIITGIDSGKLSSDLRPVYSFVNKLELNVQTTLTDNDDFGIAFTAGLQLIHLRDSYYKQFDAAVVDPFNKITAMLSVNDALNGRKPSPIYYTSLVVEKKWGDENSNCAFIRTNYYYQSGNYNKPVSTNVPQGTPVFAPAKFYNHFVQLQVGVALSLKKLFGISSDDEKKAPVKKGDKDNKDEKKGKAGKIYTSLF